MTTLVTWWITRDTERATRRLKLARLEAMRRGEAVLDDVVDNDLVKNRGVETPGRAAKQYLQDHSSFVDSKFQFPHKPSSVLAFAKLTVSAL